MIESQIFKENLLVRIPSSQKLLAGVPTPPFARTQTTAVLECKGDSVNWSFEEYV
jgi:hypothetical protein